MVRMTLTNDNNNARIELKVYLNSDSDSSSSSSAVRAMTHVPKYMKTSEYMALEKLNWILAEPITFMTLLLQWASSLVSPTLF